VFMYKAFLSVAQLLINKKMTNGRRLVKNYLPKG
jgi:hypothetical protein